jgi:hypothetical protein
MQKSENKIKPMYFWSDGYEEHGMFRNNLKKIREDELVDVDENEENEFVFKSAVKKKKKSVADDFKRWCRKHRERLKLYARFY